MRSAVPKFSFPALCAAQMSQKNKSGQITALLCDSTGALCPCRTKYSFPQNAGLEDLLFRRNVEGGTSVLTHLKAPELLRDAKVPSSSVPLFLKEGRLLPKPAFP